MLVIGLVSKSETVTAKSKKTGEDTEYRNLAIEGFEVRPGSELASVPAAGAFIRGTVTVYWPQAGGRPVHFLTEWSPFTG